MKIALASDHAGYLYKEAIKSHLLEQGHVVADFGTDSSASVDYPDFVRPAAMAVASGECERGIVLGGSGNGEAMVSNRISGIRCGIGWNEESVRLTRQHNNANVLSLGERMMDEQTALKLVDLFLSEGFEGGRHIPRIEKIDQT